MLEYNASSSLIAAAFCSALQTWLPLNPKVQIGTEEKRAVSSSSSSKKAHNILNYCRFISVTSALDPLPVHRFKEDAVVDMDCDDAEEGGDLHGLAVNELDKFNTKKLCRIGNMWEEHEFDLNQTSFLEKHKQKKDGMDIEAIGTDKNSNDVHMADSAFRTTAVFDSFFLSASQSLVNSLNSQNFIANEKYTDANHLLTNKFEKTAFLKNSEVDYANSLRSCLFSESDSKANNLNETNLSGISVSPETKSRHVVNVLTPNSPIPEFSRLWLQNTLQKLHLPPVPADDVPLGTFSVTALQAEKKKLKLELRNFDVEFSKVFCREITREDKEAVRCLYAYYQKVKKYLNKLQQSKSTEKGSGLPNTRSCHIESAINNSYKQMSNPTISESESVAHFVSSAGTSISSCFSVSSNTSSPLNFSASAFSKLGHCHVDLKSSNTAVAHLSSSATNSARRILQFAPFSATVLSSPYCVEKYSSATVSKSSTINCISQITSQSNVCSKNEVSEEWMRLQRLRDAKHALRERLVAYQSKFREANGRPVKLYKDIAPIEREYSQYKKLKEEITACMEKLGIANSTDKNETKSKIKEALSIKHSK